MTRTAPILLYLSLTAILLFSVQVFGQQLFVSAPGQQLKVAGTSTVHDWEMISAKAEGKANITLQDGRIADISSLEVTIPATSLKSGKKAMDDNAYKALLAKEHPQIQFVLTGMDSLTLQALRAKGNLTIAGTTCLISMAVNYELSDVGETILFTGSVPITFTQFHIDPPKAMFGTISTGNALEISFEITFNSINKNTDHYENE